MQPTTEQILADALASLQLPHNTGSVSTFDASKGRHLQYHHLPTVTALVVADLDLSSASALAEYTLRGRNRLDPATQIDLCIACGPFCREEDLLSYYRGNQRRLQQMKSKYQSIGEKSDDKTACGLSANQIARPFSRAPEETAALEGLMTAALSQLESIVCRVVYCPGMSDPVTTFVTADRSDAFVTTTLHKRLTPNSRNIHHEWLPLAPGLGCTALYYLEEPWQTMALKKKHREEKKTLARGRSLSPRRQFSERGSSGGYSQSSDDALEPSLFDDTFDDTSDAAEEAHETLTSKFVDRQESSDGYLATLERLIKLAAPVDHPVPFSSELSQSILVTHYVDSQSRIAASVEPQRKDSNNTSPQSARLRNRTMPEPKDMPWPMEHDAFLRISPTLRNLMCLEIASGAASDHSPRLIRGATHTSHTSESKDSHHYDAPSCPVLLPGSLRRRGEFCIVHLTVAPVVAEHPPYRKSYGGPRFAWKVQNVDFHKMDRV